VLFFFIQTESRASDFWEGVLSTTSGGQNVFAIVNGKLYQLNDENWTYKSNFSVDNLRNLIVANNNVLYAIYSTSIKKSVDDGINWVTISNPISGNSYGAKIIGNYIYLGFYEKIYRGNISSENMNWELLYQGHYYDITVTPNNAIYITPGMIKSTDNGTTWSQTNWPEDAWSTPYIINHSENTVFVGTYWEGILYTNDGGNTWHRSSGLPEGRGVNGIYSLNNQIYARVGDQMGVLGLYSSNDNGISFNKSNTGLSHWAEQHLSELSASSNNLYISVGKRGFFISKNSGNSWQECNNGVNNLKPHNVQRIQVEENGTIWTLMARSKSSGPNPSYGVLKSVDRGVSWLEVDKELWEEYMTLEDLLVTAEGKVFIANYKPGTMNVSNDGGTSWVNQAVVIETDGNNDEENEGIYSTIDILRANNSNDKIFAGTYWDGIIRSDNNGLTWVKLTNGLPSNSGVSDLFIDDNSIYAIIASQAGYDGVYISNDDGDSWLKISSKYMNQIIKTEELLYGYGFSNELGYFTDVFYVSSDNGQTWSYINQGLPSSNFRIFDILITPNSSDKKSKTSTYDKKLFLATNNGIYQLNFDNNTFSKVSNTIAFTLFWDKFNNEVIVGKENGITITSDVTLNVLENLHNIKSTPILYPNPFSNTLHIRTSHDNELVKEIRIIDINGRNMKSFNLNSSNISLSLLHLSKGVYFVKITTNITTYTERVIKQ
jgi:photosystem II stability/assembly factor-like uncharacterized protein